MKKLLSTLIILGAIHTNEIASQDVEEIIVVTSALIDTTEITNPLYVIDGDEIIDDATTSLGDAIDSYLGVSIADYGAAVGQPIIRGMSGPRVKILKNGMVNRDVSGLGADHLNDVDLNDIEQIEIVKGPSSLLYANGTIGGIINKSQVFFMPVFVVMIFITMIIVIFLFMHDRTIGDIIIPKFSIFITKINVKAIEIIFKVNEFR